MTDDSFIGGLSIHEASDDALLLLQDARKDNFDFITTKLPHASTISRRDVTLIESKWWSTSIVGMVTTPMDSSIYPFEKSEDDDEEMTGEKGPAYDFGEGIVSALSDPHRKSAAAKHFEYMLDWTAHMNIPAAILPPIPSQPEQYLQYGRFLATQVLKSSANNVHLWVRVNFDRESIERFMMIHRMCDGASNLGCMVVFQSDKTPKIQIHSKSGHANDQNDSEGGTISMAEASTLLHQLIGCNLRAVNFQTDIFLANKKGFPTLSKAMQILFLELLKRLGRTCRVLVEGLPQSIHEPAPSSTGNDDMVMGHSGLLLYLQYLRHLRSKKEVKEVIDTEEAKMETGYLDHLQSALQPLGDNLEFSTYEVFEKDPVKYARYQEAVELALRDKIHLDHLRTEMSPGSNDAIIYATIFVVGAGRGPLVNASLRAIDAVNKANRIPLPHKNISHFKIKPRIVAVEKNPSAVLYLNSLKTHNPKWKVVEVVECDMREADQNPLLAEIISGDPSGKTDIVVSELLGSFGCNELSPECLDGFQQSGLLKETGVSIPQSYASFLAPVTSMKLHAEAHAHAFLPADSIEGPGGKPCGVLQAMETPYVVRSHAASQLHEEMPCWEFSHPVEKSGMCVRDSAKDVDNERSAQVTFQIDKDSGRNYGSGYQEQNDKLMPLLESSKEAGKDSLKTNIIHGFLGTFHCTLYRSVAGGEEKASTISIAPNSFSVGMFSWFPLYFPLREPQVVPQGSNVRCNMWRRCDEGRVWYEWCSEIFHEKNIVAVSNVHNPNGRSCFVRL